MRTCRKLLGKGLKRNRTRCSSMAGIRKILAKAADSGQTGIWRELHMPAFTQSFKELSMKRRLGIMAKGKVGAQQMTVLPLFFVTEYQ